MRQFAQNPLPGMNPWLEAYWGDVHTRLTMYACDEIQRQLPPMLHAHVEEYLAVEEEDADSSGRRISPDIVVRGTVHDLSPVRTDAPVAVLDDPTTEPVTFRRVAERQTLRYVRIVDLKNNHRVVTVVEFISPANKTPAGKEQYRRKQNELIDGGVSLVEIDLLRRGEWVIASDFMSYPARLKAPYRICVTRSTALLDGEAYAACFSVPLPSIRIPLRATDADISLPLQKLLNQAYENGRYGSILDYDQQPEIGCSPQQWEWIQKRLDQVAASK